MFLVSVIGIGNTIGRVVCGVASSLPGVNALVVNNIFISTGGLLTILSGLSLTQGFQFFYAASFGISICKYTIQNIKEKSSIENYYLNFDSCLRLPEIDHRGRSAESGKTDQCFWVASSVPRRGSCRGRASRR